MKRNSWILCLLILVISINIFVPKQIEVQALGSSARGMCVIEASSGRVLYEQNKDRQLAMASTTKVVTALTVLNNCENLEEEIIVLEKKIKDNAVLREKERAEEDFIKEKNKLDKALAMDIISQEEYDVKLSSAMQYDMKLISKEERDEMIKTLTE